MFNLYAAGLACKNNTEMENIKLREKEALNNSCMLHYYLEICTCSQSFYFMSCNDLVTEYM